MSTGREIRLIEEAEGGWSAIDEAVALHTGEAGEPVTDEDLEGLGLDPDEVPNEVGEPDAPWFDDADENFINLSSIRDTN